MNEMQSGPCSMQRRGSEQQVRSAPLKTLDESPFSLLSGPAPPPGSMEEIACSTANVAGISSVFALA